MFICQDAGEFFMLQNWICGVKDFVSTSYICLEDGHPERLSDEGKEARSFTFENLNSTLSEFIENECKVFR